MAELDDLRKEVAHLRRWSYDAARELREFEEWQANVKPFLEQLQADLIYRQRRHADRASDWSTFAKVVTLVGGALVALSAIGAFILQIAHAVSG